MWLLNFALLAVVAVLGQQLRHNWLEARRREAMLMSVSAPPATGPTYAKAAVLPPVTAASYLEVADKLLFSRDRNSKVELPPPPPPPAPPPKPVMPPLPRAFGFMNWNGPRALLAEKSGGPQKSYAPGDKIGEFTVVAVDRQNITFDWNGEQIVKTWEDLKDTQPTGIVAGAAPVNSNNNGGPVLGGAMEKAPAMPEPKQTTADNSRPMGPNPDAGGVPHGCQPGDTTPVGQVVNGYRKTERNTPFGKSCFWDPVQ